eukprot:1953443-Rhodomonas_salina.3
MRLHSMHTLQLRRDLREIPSQSRLWIHDSDPRVRVSVLQSLLLTRLLLCTTRVPVNGYPGTQHKGRGGNRVERLQ